MAIESCDEIGLGDACFDINDARVVDGILAGVGLTGAAVVAAKALMKDRNVVGLRAFERPLLVEFALRRGGRETIAQARAVCATPESQQALDRLEELLARAESLGYADRVAIDFALLRDLEYYTGFIFEGYVPEMGFPLCGGGRYDALLPAFGFDVPAVGWSAGVERILIALERRGKHLSRRRHRVDVLVSGTDVAAARERAAGNIVRYAAGGQNDEELIAEARAHGIPRVVVAENGSVRELRVSPLPESRLPAESFARSWEAR
jgi:ATP phosphoribosyltransferase regulatory subunit